MWSLVNKDRSMKMAFYYRPVLHYCLIAWSLKKRHSFTDWFCFRSFKSTVSPEKSWPTTWPDNSIQHLGLCHHLPKVHVYPGQPLASEAGQGPDHPSHTNPLPVRTHPHHPGLRLQQAANLENRSGWLTTISTGTTWLSKKSHHSPIHNECEC